MSTQAAGRSRAIGTCLLAALATGCNFNGSFGPQLKGSGVAKTEERAVDAFSEILVEGPIELELTVGPAASVVVTSDDNILPHVVTHVAGDRLTIAVDTSYSTNLGVKITATTPALTELLAHGASTCIVSDVATERFALDVGSASRCTFEGHVDVMYVIMTAASHAMLEGSAQELNVDCSGASRVEATDMPADRVTATVAGASTALVAAAEELTANASGASTVRYRGEPATVKQDTSGASTIAAE